MRIAMNLSLILCALFSLAACRDEFFVTPNGEIPSQYIEKVRPLLGLYKGFFNGQELAINLYLDGSKLKVNVLDSSGYAGDLLGSGCRSSVGKMDVVTIGKKIEANFNFDRGNCSNLVVGRSLDLRIPLSEMGGSRISIFASILKTYEATNSGGGTVTCHENGDGAGGIDCINDGIGGGAITTYLEGRFDK